MKVEKSSGNVFKDLGFDQPEEAQAKAKLALHITLFIKKRKLTQVQAAKLLGIDQPKISRLSRGLLNEFSIGTLLNFLLKLNKDIEIIVKPHRRKTSHITVAA